MLHNETDLADVIRTSPLFDAEWYGAQYPDVLAAAADPARHYLLEGGFQQRDPGPAFSSEYYLRANPDVRRAAFNPLLHYILHGFGEGRSSTNAHLGWIEQSEMLDDVDRVAIRQHIAGLTRHPILSVVVPVYNPDPQHLSEMIASVTKQAYPYWELCIADDRSADPSVSRILRDAAAVDRRIKLAFRAENGHICAATNTAIGLATGEFICLLDHDDLLHENALYEIAAELDTHPDADIIYSDSDHVDDDGGRYRPYFKTDWNYDLMLGHNMISHLGAYRRSIVETVGGLRTGYEGSQDYDLALRVADASTPSRIRHIPAVLYHWRRPFAAESFSDRAQAECVALARKAVTDHLARRGIDARVEPAPHAPNFSRVVYALPALHPLVTVALLLSEGDGVVEQIGDILLRTTYEPLELLVIASEPTAPETDAVLRRAANDPRVRVVRLDGSPSRMRAKNRAVDDARGDVVVLLDGDLRPSDPEWLTAMVSHAMRPGIGLVGSPVVGAEGTIVDAGIVLNRAAPDAPINGRYDRYFSIFALTREVSAVASACVAFRRSVYVDAGGMSEAGTLQQAEIELCRRAHSAGYRNILTPDAELRRNASGSGSDGARELDATPPARHDEDPFYSPNLSLEHVFEEASFPSRRVKPWAAARRRLATREGQARRARVLLDGVARSARILEVGPSYSPIAPKADGWKTTVVDHTTRTNLVEKYRHELDVWVDRIEDVDFIGSDGSIADAVPAALHGTFDVVVASHVIEHVPDVIAFLQSTATLLRDDGTVILAVPDKRFCFDYFRPLATTAQVLEAHESGRTRHTRRTAFEQYAYSVNNDGTGAWGQEAVANVTFALGFGTAVDLLTAFDADRETAYVDMHAWQFTPSSFQLILLELARLRHLDWAVEHITPATGCEFRVRLRRGGIQKAWAMSEDELGARRLALLRGTLCEIGEQARFAADDFRGTVAT